MNKIKRIEDFLCDFLDELFNDNLKSVKEFDITKCPIRVAYLSEGLNQLDDQNIANTTKGKFAITTRKRSDAISEFSKISEALPVHTKISDENEDKSFVISLIKDYSIVPYKILVGTMPAYTATINIKIITTT